MARTPRAKVSSTSGQGISRLAYQKAYRMKGGLTSRFSSGGGGGGSSGERNRYAKVKAPDVGGINVSYGDTYFPTDLKDIEGFGKDAQIKSSVGSGKSDKKWRKK